MQGINCKGQATVQGDPLGPVFVVQAGDDLTWNLILGAQLVRSGRYNLLMNWEWDGSKRQKSRMASRLLT